MEKRLSRLAPGAAAFVVAAAVALLVWPRGVERLTGILVEPQLAAPDDLPVAAKDDPLPFLHERDEIEIRVTEATTLRQFLDRNRLNKDSQVRQIAEQLGSAAPDTAIAAGTRFRIRLTPTEAVPGAPAAGQRR